jgi:hypothetical protein
MNFVSAVRGRRLDKVVVEQGRSSVHLAVSEELSTLGNFFMYIKLLRSVYCKSKLSNCVSIQLASGQRTLVIFKFTVKSTRAKVWTG